MPNIKSSKKAVKVIAKKTANNHELKMRVQNLIKNCEKAIAANNKEEADKLLKDIQKYADKAVLIDKTVVASGDVEEVFKTDAFKQIFGFMDMEK